MGRAVMPERFDTGAEAVAAAASHIAAALERGIGDRGAASFVATGGRAPGPVYAELARRPLDWARVTVTLSDERWVGEDDPDSNAALVRNQLLTGPAAAARFVGLKTDHARARDAEDEVGRRLSRIAWPFDLVMLGMGDDGHVASLFPGSPVLAQGLEPHGARRCIAVPMGAASAPPIQPRMSLTLAAITAARGVLIYVAGSGKWDVLRQAMAGDDAMAMPVRAVLNGPAPVRVIWAP